MNVRMNLGNFVLDITAINENSDVIRVKKIYIDKISNIYDGMKLSEWINKDGIDNIVRTYMENSDDKTIIYSRQPRKRLRRFNIL